MNVKEKFLEFTKETYPHGSEQDLFHILPEFLKKDQFGNLYHQIGNTPSTMFTCHLDTASHTKVKVNHVIKENKIYSDGTTILGADDKAGLVVLLALIEKEIPGLYYFFLGEERGCIGSRKVAELHSKFKIDHINKVVSFDRRGYDSVITHQMSGRCCSNTFAQELSTKLNEKSKNLFENSFKYSPDPTGIYTDSAQFINIYAECTNISVGYHNEHTHSETQDIDHLDKLCQTVTLIDWETLTIERDPLKTDYYDDDIEYEFGYSQSYPKYSSKYKDIDDIFDDDNKSCSVKTAILDTEFYGHETTVSYEYNTYEITQVKPHPGRIMKEKEKIENLLTSLEVDYDELLWDGNMLIIRSLDDKDITLTRMDIAGYLTNFNDWIETELKYKSIS
jgi:hypothetical protein